MIVNLVLNLLKVRLKLLSTVACNIKRKFWQILKTCKGFLRKHIKNTLKISCKNYEENIDNIADGT